MSQLDLSQHRQAAFLLNPMSSQPKSNRQSAIVAYLKSLQKPKAAPQRGLNNPDCFCSHPDKFRPNNTDLNSYCLEKIFAYIPMQKLLQYRLVCKQWCEEIEALCRRQKKSLILRCSKSYFFEEIEPIWSFGKRLFNTIDLDNFVVISTFKSPGFFASRKRRKLTEEFCQFCLRLFPAPRELVLYGIKKSIYESFHTQLFSHWTPNVVSLSLTYRQIWSAFEWMSSLINSFIHLKHLDMFDMNCDLAPLLPHILPTLERIEHLSIKVCKDPIRYYFKDLPNYFTHYLMPNCTRFWYEGCWEHSGEKDPMMESFLAKLTHLQMKTASDYDLEHFLPRTSSVRVLSLYIRRNLYDKLQSCKVFDQLAHLHNLTELRLFKLPRTCTICLPPKDRISPLCGVRKLVLEGGKYSTFAYIIPAVEAYFPNLEVFTISFPATFGKSLLEVFYSVADNFSKPPKRTQFSYNLRRYDYVHFYW